MPVSFLSDDQALRYGRFVGDPTSEQLARHFHLDDADRAFIGAHRGDHNRLGVAVQLGSLRLLGTFLEDPAQIPASVTRFAGDQLAIDGSAELMARYCATKGRWRHGPRIGRGKGTARDANSPGANATAVNHLPIRPRPNSVALRCAAWAPIAGRRHAAGILG